MGHNEITGDILDVEHENDNQPLIEDNDSQSHFWFRLLLLCKKRWKLLLFVLLTLIIGASILIGYLHDKGIHSVFFLKVCKYKLVVSVFHPHYLHKYKVT